MNKVVLDTCGWLAYFADEPHAEKFAPQIDEEGRILVPAVVEYEVHRWALREVGEDKANEYAAAISRHDAVPLTATLARRAAELGRVRDIAACDAPVYATAEAQSVVLVTADPDLQGLPGVEFHEKAGASGATKKAKRRPGGSGGRARKARRSTCLNGPSGDKWTADRAPADGGRRWVPLRARHGAHPAPLGSARRWRR